MTTHDEARGMILEAKGDMLIGVTHGKFWRMRGHLVTRLGDGLKGPRDMLVMPSMSLTFGDEDDLNMTFSDEAGGCDLLVRG